VSSATASGPATAPLTPVPSPSPALCDLAPGVQPHLLPPLVLPGGTGTVVAAMTGLPFYFGGSECSDTVAAVIPEARSQAMFSILVPPSARGSLTFTTCSPNTTFSTQVSCPIMSRL
jgi:hypothetical protein